MAFSPIYAIKDRHGRSTLLPYKQGVDDGSTLTLDFTTGVLDPRLAHSRLGNGTFINSQGLVQFANANLLQRSQDYTVVAWTKFRIDTTTSGLNTANTTTAPDGTSTGLLLKSDGVSGTHRVLQSNGTTGSTALSTNGISTVTLSAYFKANGSNFCSLKVSNNIESRGCTRNFNLTNGVVSGAEDAGWSVVSASASPVGNGWYRCQITVALTRVDANDDQMGIWLFVANGPDTADRSFTNSAASVWVWGAQVSIGANALEYRATTAAPYYAPRFDYDPTTFAPRGLLFEGEGENRALNSETFPTTGTGQWGPTGVNQNATKITSPDGTANAIQFNETTNNELHRINQGITGSAGPYTISIWAKALDTGSPRRLFLNAVGFMNASALFDLDPAVQTGASGSAVAVAGTAANRAGTWIKYPNGWYRCILVGQYNTNSSLFLQINRASSTTASDDTYAGSATNGLALWGVQVEKGVGASSYIPTGVSQGARVAESCVMNDITALNYSTQQGTIYWNGRFNRQPYDSYVTVVGFMTAIDQPAFETFSNAANYFVAARGPNLQASGSNETSRPYTLNTPIKYAATANTVTNPVVRANLNGSASVANKTGTDDMHVATRFVIGRQPIGTYGVNYPSLTIAQIKYWPFARSASELTALTAP